MKFTITSITEEGVKAKEDNPIIQKKDLGDDLCKYCSLEKKGAYGVDGGYMAGCEGSRCNESYDNYLELWQEAEANRKEYKIAKTEIIDMTIIEGDFDYRIGNQGISYPTELGDQIDADIKDNQIINIKIL